MCPSYGLFYKKWFPPDSMNLRTFRSSSSTALILQLLKWPYRPTAPTSSVEELICLKIHAYISSKPHSWQPTVDTVFALTFFSNSACRHR